MQTSPKCGMCGKSVAADPKATTLFGLPVHKACSKSFNDKRHHAAMIDWFLLLSLSWFAFHPLTAHFSEIEKLDPNVLPLAISGVLLLCKDAWRGMSLGKRITGLQVVDADTNEPIGLWKSVQRNLFLLVLLGFALPASPEAQSALVGLLLGVSYRMRLGLRDGESWANTRVIDRNAKFAPVFKPIHVGDPDRDSIAA